MIVHVYGFPVLFFLIKQNFLKWKGFFLYDLYHVVQKGGVWGGMAIWHTLCCRRHIKMRELAEMYGVTTRTIRLDVEHLSLTYPIETVRGRYDGCVKIPDWYIPTTSPLNAIQMDFLVNLQKTMVGTDADMLRGIISALTPM